MLIQQSALLSGRPLLSLNIVVTLGSGAGCFFGVLLQDLGVYVVGSIHTDPDGTFLENF